MVGNQRRVGVVVGNPRPGSATHGVCSDVARRLAGEDEPTTIDLATLDPGDLAWGSETIAEAVARLDRVDVLVVGSPTYKASYTGLLKLFLDHLPQDGLGGKVAVPVMVGHGLAHSLAPEVHLRPVLVELGARCPSRALFVDASAGDTDEAVDAWAQRALPEIIGSKA